MYTMIVTMNNLLANNKIDIDFIRSYYICITNEIQALINSMQKTNKN